MTNNNENKGCSSYFSFFPRRIQFERLLFANSIDSCFTFCCRGGANAKKCPSRQRFLCFVFQSSSIDHIKSPITIIVLL